jgi:hypothetical protein
MVEELYTYQMLEYKRIALYLTVKQKGYVIYAAAKLGSYLQ